MFTDIVPRSNFEKLISYLLVFNIFISSSCTPVYAMNNYLGDVYVDTQIQNLSIVDRDFNWLRDSNVDVLRENPRPTKVLSNFENYVNSLDDTHEPKINVDLDNINYNFHGDDSTYTSPAAVNAVIVDSSANYLEFSELYQVTYQTSVTVKDYSLSDIQLSTTLSPTSIVPELCLRDSLETINMAYDNHRIDFDIDVSSSRELMFTWYIYTDDVDELLNMSLDYISSVPLQGVQSVSTMSTFDPDTFEGLIIDISNPVAGEGISIEGNNIIITQDGEYLFAGETSVNYITINANVAAICYFNGVSIDNETISIVLQDDSNVDLYLVANSENELISGITVPEAAVLTICGAGSLDVVGDIGNMSYQQRGGAINITDSVDITIAGAINSYYRSEGILTISDNAVVTILSEEDGGDHDSGYGIYEYSLSAIDNATINIDGSIYADDINIAGHATIITNDGEITSTTALIEDFSTVRTDNLYSEYSSGHITIQDSSVVDMDGYLNYSEITIKDSANVLVAGSLGLASELITISDLAIVNCSGGMLAWKVIIEGQTVVTVTDDVVMDYDGIEIHGIAIGESIKICDLATVSAIGGITAFDGACVEFVTILISGDANVEAIGVEYSAGIGGSVSDSRHEIIIQDRAVVVAAGGDYGAGIGGGRYGNGGSIVIENEAKVIAVGGTRAAGIGGGENGVSGFIVIRDNPEVIATGTDGGAGIGDGQGYLGSELGHREWDISLGDYVWIDDTISIEGGDITATGGKHASGIGGGYFGSGGLIMIQDSHVVATGGDYAAGIGGGHYGNGGVGYIYRDESFYDENNHWCVDWLVEIGGGIYITNSSVVATGGRSGAGIGSGMGFDYAYAHAGKIEIDGDSNIIATGGEYAAGIGGGHYGHGGEIIIRDGLINATGGDSGAGIGGGWDGSGGYIHHYIPIVEGVEDVLHEGGEISIDGGTVQATGGEFAAGIGGGEYGRSGVINISGDATVTSLGGDSGAGIGSGALYEFAEPARVVQPLIEPAFATYGLSDRVWDITISSNAIVTATGGEYGAGIGGGGEDDDGGRAGYQGNGGNGETDGRIRITDYANVTATGGTSAAGIGGGEGGDGGDIYIGYDSQVTATGADGGAGIGGGEYGDGGYIDIYGSPEVRAISGELGVGIGRGLGGYDCTLVIESHATVSAFNKDENLPPIEDFDGEEGDDAVFVSARLASPIAVTTGLDYTILTSERAGSSSIWKLPEGYTGFAFTGFAFPGEGNPEPHTVKATVGDIERSIVYSYDSLDPEQPNYYDTYDRSNVIPSMFVPQYTINYNANGGTGSTFSASADGRYSSVRLDSGANFSKDDLVVRGWNTSPDGLGTSYSLNKTTTINDLAYTFDGSNQSLTLYAKYGVPSEYTVSVESDMSLVTWGDIVTYTITATNDSSDSWDNVEVTDLLSNYLTYQSHETEDGVTLVANDATLSLNFGDIGSHSSKSIDIITHVKDGAPHLLVLENELSYINPVDLEPCVGVDPLPPSVIGEPDLQPIADIVHMLGSSFDPISIINNGTPVDNWDVQGLPNGLSFNSTTKKIAGNPTATGISAVTVIATVDGKSIDWRISFKITVIDGLQAPALSPIGNHVHTLGESFSDISVINTGGVVDTWSATGLPTGLAFNGSTKKITGSPLSVGVCNVSITATNAAGSSTVSFTVTVVNALSPPALSPISDRTYIIGDDFDSISIMNSGGLIASWMVTGLPDGVTFNEASQTLQGTPTILGVYNISITATNSAGNSTINFKIIVTAYSELPSVDEIIEGDRIITGEGVPGADIVVTLPDDSTLTTIVKPDGTWSVTLPDDADDLEFGDEVTVVQTEEGKKPSSEVEGLVGGVSSPPTINSIIEGDGTIEGSGIPGAIIIVTLPDNSTLTTTVKPDGTWIVLVPSDVVLHENDIVIATQTEYGKTISEDTSTVVIGRSEPPTIDIIIEGDDTIGGQGVPDALITVTFPDNSTVITTVDKDGYWIVDVPDHIVLAIDDVVEAIQVEVGKVPSTVVDETVVADDVNSRPPIIDRIDEDDAEITGRGIPDSEILVTFPDGQIVITKVGPDGKWAVQIPDGVDLKVAEIVSATQTEEGKLPSQPVDEVVVAISLPPIINMIRDTDTTVSGEGVPGATVIVTFPDGQQKTVVVDSDGKWIVSISDSLTLHYNDKVSATQTEVGKSVSHRVTESVVSAPNLEPISDRVHTLGNLFPSISVVNRGGPIRTWTVEGFPRDLTFNNLAQIITGTPRDIGVHSVTITAINDAGTSTVTFTITVKGRTNGNSYKNNAKEYTVRDEIPTVPLVIDIPELDKASHLKYLNGYPDGSVAPDREMTRAEASQILFNLIIDPAKSTYSTDSKFEDVPNGMWYSQAINYLTAHNIIEGYPDGTFRPDESVSRAEFATLISKFDSLEPVDDSVYIDVPSSHWAAPYINSASSKGWINGYPDGTFRPERFITRAEVVTLLNKVLERLIWLRDLPDWIPRYSDLTPQHWAYTDIIEASAAHSYIRREDGSEVWSEV